MEHDLRTVAHVSANVELSVWMLEDGQRSIEHVLCFAEQYHYPQNAVFVSISMFYGPQNMFVVSQKSYHRNPSSSLGSFAFAVDSMNTDKIQGQIMRFRV